MAFAAELAALTEELVQAVTNTHLQDEASKFKAHRDAALRTFKTHSFLRTNPFEVDDNLAGLEERFRVNHREGLADALRQRLHGLQAVPLGWHPEALLLLLELSDQPTFKSTLSDLKSLDGAEDGRVEALQWQDIAREDGWEEDAALWSIVEYSDDSDDEISHSPSTDGQGERSSISSEEPACSSAEVFIRQSQNVCLFNAVRKAQEWRTVQAAPDSSDHTRKRGLEETHVVREVLYMLQGIGTTLFDSRSTAVSSFQISHLRWETYKALADTFAQSGCQLQVLRDFVREPQQASYLQAFQDCIGARLDLFDSKMTEMHGILASPKDVVVITLVSVKAELEPWLQPLCALGRVVSNMNTQTAANAKAFRHLELLFDEASMAQLSGNSSIYGFLARIFIECFNVYLGPIRLWMDEGELVPKDEIFFVSESSKEASSKPSQIWVDRFELIYGDDGALHAPSFLHPAIGKILNAGKNIVVLKRLGKYVAASPHCPSTEQSLDYEILCLEDCELAPFPDLFAEAFERWFQRKYQTTSITLKDALFQTCELPLAAQALQHLYLMSDGSAAAAFCKGLFDRIDGLDPKWHDRYALIAIAHEAFGSLVDINRLSIDIASRGKEMTVSSAKSSVRSILPYLQLSYRFPWPIQMIISSDSLSMYQTVFTLLLQVKRAAHVLYQTKILDQYWSDDKNWFERALYYSCRHSLLWFVLTVQTYLTTLVLAPNVWLLDKEMNDAVDVDGLIQIHNVFIERIVNESCLGNRLTPIREAILDMFDLAIKLEQPADDYLAVLKSTKFDFERHLHFICGGLRSVSRATGDAAGAKWETLAEMLQLGSNNTSA